MDWLLYMYFLMGTDIFSWKINLYVKCQASIKKYSKYIRISACYPRLVLLLLCYASRCIIFKCLALYISHRLNILVLLRLIRTVCPYRFWLFWLDWQCPSRCHMCSFHPRDYNHQKQKCSLLFMWEVLPHMAYKIDFELSLVSLVFTVVCVYMYAQAHIY